MHDDGGDSVMQGRASSENTKVNCICTASLLSHATITVKDMIFESELLPRCVWGAGKSACPRSDLHFTLATHTLTSIIVASCGYRDVRQRPASPRICSLDDLSSSPKWLCMKWPNKRIKKQPGTGHQQVMGSCLQQSNPRTNFDLQRNGDLSALICCRLCVSWPLFVLSLGP